MATLNQDAGRTQACLSLHIQTQTVSVMIAPPASWANVICINNVKKEEGRESKIYLYCLLKCQAWRGFNNKDAM